MTRHTNSKLSLLNSITWKIRSRCAHVTSSRVTELFMGNLPPDADAATLKEFLNAAMTETKLTTSPGQAINEIRYNQGSKYAFLRMRTPEECTNALCMTGIPYMSSFLKIERPGTFPGVKTGAMTWQELTGGAERVAPPTDGAAGSASTANALVLANLMMGGNGGAVDPMTKPLRELFIGNVVVGTPPNEIQEFLGAVMGEVGLADESLGGGNPILNVRTNGKFAFVELRSVDETNNALNMGEAAYPSYLRHGCSHLNDRKELNPTLFVALVINA